MSSTPTASVQCMHAGHYLYVASSIHWIDAGLVKIGSTDNPAARIAAYHTCNPGTLEGRPENLAIFRVNDPSTQLRAMMIEREIALRHTKEKTHNEWYRMTPEEAERIISEFDCTKIDIAPRIAREPEPARTIAYACLGTDAPSPQSIDAHTRAMSDAQAPMIRALAEFLADPDPDPDRQARTLIAPCGFGKTRITTDALTIANISPDRVAICAPTLNLCAQWRERAPGAHVVTNMSARDELEPKLADLRVVIFDEAHHMAGPIASEDQTEGATRVLLANICANAPHIKRVFLTFTPRNAIGDDARDMFSMDDPLVFGEQDVAPDLRDCVARGLLPDYRITIMQGETTGEDTMRAKCEQLAQVLDARDHYAPGLHMINNLLVYVRGIADIARCVDMLRELVPDCEIRGAYSETCTADVALFRRAVREGRRAILVSCRVLGEGADIPEACAVAIMYAKKSPIDITQMILRAGRWAPLKPVWHMIFPLIKGDDYEGFRNVLATLALRDSRIIDDATRIRARGKRDDLLGATHPSRDEMCAHDLAIFSDTFDATNIARISQYFGALLDDHIARISGRGLRDLYEFARAANIAHGLRGRADYMRALRADELPLKIENPQARFADYWESWYAFLGLSVAAFPPTVRDLAMLCRVYGVETLAEYDAKRASDAAFGARTPEEPGEVYGAEYENFTQMMCVITQISSRRRSAIH